MVPYLLVMAWLVGGFGALNCGDFDTQFNPSGLPSGCVGWVDMIGNYLLGEILLLVLI